jgi:hypothetical protein
MGFLVIEAKTDDAGKPIVIVSSDPSGEELTPAEARRIASALMSAADKAEGIARLEELTREEAKR